MAVLFISDLHLSPERPAVARAFLVFLQQRAASANALYILGDLLKLGLVTTTPANLPWRFKQLCEH